jgi:hypothetical protein
MTTLTIASLASSSAAAAPAPGPHALHGHGLRPRARDVAAAAAAAAAALQQQRIEMRKAAAVFFSPANQRAARAIERSQKFDELRTRKCADEEQDSHTSDLEPEPVDEVSTALVAAPVADPTSEEANTMAIDAAM